MKSNKTSFKKGDYPKNGFDKNPPLKERNINWKGGITPLNSKLRNSSMNKIWREFCFLRDNFTCQECGQIGGKLHCHHIKLFSKYPELRFVVNNGITLCKECHIKLHKMEVINYGR